MSVAGTPLLDSHSNLFAIDDRGVITLGRKPLDSERGTFYDLNITATDQNGNAASTLLHVKLEGIPGVGSSTPKPPKMPCRFPVKIYNTEVPENQQGKKKLTKVTSSCEIERKPVKYLISQGEGKKNRDDKKFISLNQGHEEFSCLEMRTIDSQPKIRITYFQAKI